MSTRTTLLRWLVVATLAASFARPVGAVDIGQIKVAKGQVTIERGGLSSWLPVRAPGSNLAIS